MLSWIVVLAFNENSLTKIDGMTCLKVKQA